MRATMRSALAVLAAGLAAAVPPLAHAQDTPLARAGGFQLASARQTSADPLAAASYLADKFKNGDAIPGARPGDAGGQTAILQGQDASENSQTPWCNNTVFIGSSQVGGSQDSGWTELPQVLGFDLKRDLHVSSNGKGGVQPYYVEANKDPKKIKRVILVNPGKPRDSWKYANLVRNSLHCAANNESMQVDLSSILIAAPAWQSNLEQKAGAVKDGSLYFSTGGWSQGRTTKGPNNASISSFKIFDDLTEKFFNKTEYPNLDSITLAGHSLGCSFTHRYAMLRKPNKNDPNLRFWYANCGSYVHSFTHSLTCLLFCSFILMQVKKEVAARMVDN